MAVERIGRMSTSGYTSCRCRDCMEIAISNDQDYPDFCWECEEADCEEDEECLVWHEDEE